MSNRNPQLQKLTDEDVAPPRQTMAQQLREARLASGLSLRQLAQKVGVSHVFACQLESGNRSIPPARLEAYCAALPYLNHDALRAHVLCKSFMGHGQRVAVDLRVELHNLRAAAAELVATLPKCDECDRPATRAFGRGAERWCDGHGEGDVYNVPVPEYPRAAPLRKVMALLGGNQ